jgi:hypothetical protein
LKGEPKVTGVYPSSLGDLVMQFPAGSAALRSLFVVTLQVFSTHLSAENVIRPLIVIPKALSGFFTTELITIDWMEGSLTPI